MLDNNYTMIVLSKALRRRRLLIGAFVAFAACLLVVVSCSSRSPSTSVYEKVDAAVSELGLDSMSAIAYTGHYGSDGFSDDPPTVVLLIGGSQAAKVVADALSEVGYTQSGATTWSRGRDEEYLSAVVAPVNPGDEFIGQDGQRQTADQDGVVLMIASA